jgi:hypothetical protein
MSRQQEIKMKNSNSRPSTPSKEKFSLLMKKPSFGKITETPKGITKPYSGAPGVSQNIFLNNSRNLFEESKFNTNGRKTNLLLTTPPSREQTFSPNSSSNRREAKFLSPKSPDLFKLNKK